MITTVSQTGSTNADLAAAVRGGEGLPEGTWLVADRQTAGKGRQGRQWFDGSGNFMGSTLVHLSPRDPSPASLALVAGLAAYEAVLPLLSDPAGLRLKWPNDLLLGGAKLAGILLERESHAVIIGIGVNLAAAPDLPGRETVSLAAFGPAPDRDLFAQSLSACFDREIERWRTYGVEPLTRRWQSVAHPLGTSLVVSPPGEAPVEGLFDGLAPDGALRLRLADGSTRVIHAGDVSHAQQES